MNSNDIIAQKAGLREQMKQIRLDIDPKNREQQNQILTQMILGTQLYEDARFILTYVSFGTEIDTKELIRKALRDNKKVYVPRVTVLPVTRDMQEDKAKKELVFYEIGNLSELKMNSMGIPEPEINPAKQFPYEMHLSLDRAEECVVLTPGLAFDKKLSRLGYGKGYYDRFLSGFRKKMAIGLSFNEQIVEEVPVCETDTALDLIVTPNGAFF